MKYKKVISFNDDITIEEVILACVNFEDQKLFNVDLNDINFFLSTKNG